MRIEIDTEKDSPETIREVVRLLAVCVGTVPVPQASTAVPLPLPDTSFPTLGPRHGGLPNMPPGALPPPPAEPLPPTSYPVPEPPAPAITIDTTEPAAELDVKGKPWDLRIHATTKTKTKDGAWKYMRGLADDVRQAVEAETPTLGPVTSPAAPPSLSVARRVAIQTENVAPNTPSQIIARVAELRSLGRLEDSTLADICKKCGIEGVTFVMGLNAAACTDFNNLLEDSLL